MNKDKHSAIQEYITSRIPDHANKNCEYFMR